jgi:hypothetical protein
MPLPTPTTNPGPSRKALLSESSRPAGQLAHAISRGGCRAMGVDDDSRIEEREDFFNQD